MSLSLTPCPQPLVQIKQLKTERGVQALYSTLPPRPEEEWGEDPHSPQTVEMGRHTIQGDQDCPGAQTPRPVTTKIDKAAPEEEVQRKGRNHGNLTMAALSWCFIYTAPRPSPQPFGVVTLTGTFHKPHRRRHKTHVTYWRHITIGKQ